MVTIQQFIERNSIPSGPACATITPDVAMMLQQQYDYALAGQPWTAAHCPTPLRDEFLRIVRENIRLRDLRALPEKDQIFRIPKNAILI
ncbi:MAG: hypothetical protein E6Q97_31495 [Desulfurellales bacterium]|nr:MAG: hypothetical protein E6Q97_31495 [Desulfurellales bacterium]